MTSIGSSAFQYCYALASVTIPEGVTSIGSSAFSSCYALTDFACNGALTTLGDGAFSSSSSLPAMRLARAELPNMAVASLGTALGSSTAANACQNLEVLDLGFTAAIAANALANCRKLSTLVLRKSDAICSLADVSAFTNTPMRGYQSRTGTIYVPQALIETYKAATNWSTIFAQGFLTFAPIEGSEWEIA